MSTAARQHDRDHRGRQLHHHPASAADGIAMRAGRARARLRDVVIAAGRRSAREVGKTIVVEVPVGPMPHLALPRHLEAVRLEPGTYYDEQRRVAELLGRKASPGRVWVLVSAGVRHLVVAAKVDVRETGMDVFDSPFDGT